MGEINALYGWIVKFASEGAQWRMLSPEEMSYKTWSAAVCMMV